MLSSYRNVNEISNMFSPDQPTPSLQLLSRRHTHTVLLLAARQYLTKQALQVKHYHEQHSKFIHLFLLLYSKNKSFFKQNVLTASRSRFAKNRERIFVQFQHIFYM